MIGIYAIENRLNKRVYVGKSTDIFKRWEQHLWLLENGRHHSFKLQSDYDELGIKNFSFRILELCEENQLEEKEIYWISKYNAETDGYNMTDKSLRTLASLDAENKQLKAENEKLKSDLQALINAVKQLRKENERIKKEVELIKASMEASAVSNEQKGTSEITDDELYEQAYSLIIKTRTASVSLLQRRLRIGYARAARLIDMLEANGVIGPYQGSAPREVLIEPDDGELDGTA